MKPARCLSCGCTDERACATAVGPCWWVLVDRKRGEGLCSGCATVEQLVSRMLIAAAELRGEDGVTIRELADRTGVSTPRIFRALRHLEERGLAERGGRLTNGADVWHQGAA